MVKARDSVKDLTACSSSGSRMFSSTRSEDSRSVSQSLVEVCGLALLHQLELSRLGQMGPTPFESTKTERKEYS